MSLLRIFGSRFLSLFRKRHLEQELEAEIRSHVEMQIEENLKKGMSPEQARNAALRSFGGVDQAKEAYRDQRGLPFLKTIFQDLRYGLRMLAKNPGFTAVAVITLALGIGANTAIFSVVNAVLLRPLPYKDADRLVTVWGYNRARGFNTDQVSPPDFDDWRSQNHVFEAIAASTDAMYTLTGAGDPAPIIAYSFSADYFHVLGVTPLAGRTFLSEEEQPGKNHVVILSYSLWLRVFGGDRSLVGKTITLDGTPYTVVGIMPPHSEYPPFTALWTPLTIVPEAAHDRAYRYLRVTARMKPGVTLQQAQTEMNTIARRLALEYPKTNKDEDATNLIGLRQMISGDIRPALLVLMCAVGLVLFIACANVANLLLARMSGRQKEVAVRAALGASRSRLVRQLLTESCLLSLAGGSIGILVAFWCSHALLSMFPPTIFNLSIPHVDAIPMDGWVLGFALSVSLLTGAVFGLFPAFQAGRLNANQALKESGRSVSSRQGRRFRNALVVAEMSLSLVLLVAAGLTLESLAHLLRSDLGFDPKNVLSMRVLLPNYKYATHSQRVAFSDQALELLQSLPGVTSVGTVTFLPLSGWEGDRGVSLAGQSMAQNQRPIALWSSVTPGYFSSMKIPLLEGRFFSNQDANSGAVAIVSKSLAHELSSSEDPVGKRLNVDGLKDPVEIVGVVGDVHHLGMTSNMTAEIYFPFSQVPTPILCFTLRTREDPAGVAKAAEQAIWSVDKDQAVGFVMTMSDLASESLAPRRAITILLGAFAGMALLLALVGTYGVISCSAAERTHEIGLRMALGASSNDVLRLVVRQGLALVLAGAAIGLAGAVALMRFIASLLYGVRPSDPVSFVAATVLLIAAAMSASYIPARRATKVDPTVALRYE